MNATTTQIPNPLQNQQAEKAIHAKPKPDPTPLEQVHSARTRRFSPSACGTTSRARSSPSGSTT